MLMGLCGCYDCIWLSGGFREEIETLFSRGTVEDALVIQQRFWLIWMCFPGCDRRNIYDFVYLTFINIYLLNTSLIYLYFTLLLLLGGQESRGDEKNHATKQWNPLMRIIRSSSYEKNMILAESQNHRIQKLVLSRTGISSYIRMNSHICHLLPSFREAIVWRRKGINKEPETN